MALSDGLLGGFADLVGGYFGRVQAAKQAAMDAPYRQQLQGLLGMAPDNPEAAGLQGPAFAGSGLLANPNDPRAQQTFAAGLLGLGGRYADTGANMLNAAFQRAQAGDQFNRSETRQAEQFSATHSLAQQQAAELAAQRQLQAQQWTQQFDAEQRYRAAMLGNDTARLNLARDAAQAKADGPEMPKLPVGYGYVKDATGSTVAAPMPNTPDWTKAVELDKTYQGARAEIQQLTDLMEGITRDPKTGAVQKKGPAIGSELWGAEAAKMGGLRAAIISRVAKLRDMGVLQAGELERIEETLPDPTAIGAKFRRNKSIIQSYRTLDDQFASKLGTHRQANTWLLPPVPGGQ